MLRALYTSATGMKAQELVIDNTANNLANVNTNGFKRSQIDFADLMYVTEEQPGALAAQTGQENAVGIQIGSGVRAIGTAKIFSPGTLEQTSNPYDMAIEGEGFFRVQKPDGTFRYTRDGAFRLDSTGKLTNGDGLLLDAPITVPQDARSVSIAADGTVSAIVGTAVAAQNLGTIQLHRFTNPGGLSSEGGNLYSETAASGTPIIMSADEISIRQGFLERSNVEVVRELISLITAQRAYEINSRAIRAGDEMLSTSADVLR